MFHHVYAISKQRPLNRPVLISEAASEEIAMAADYLGLEFESDDDHEDPLEGLFFILCLSLIARINR